MSYFIIDWEPRLADLALHVPASTYTSGTYVKTIASGEQYYRVYKCILNTSGGEAITNTTYWVEKTDAEADEYADYKADQLYPNWSGLNHIETPSNLEAVFGDGYAQIQPDGINIYRDQFTLSFSKVSGTNAKGIRMWAIANAGQGEFQYWMPDPINELWDLRLKDWRINWIQWNSFGVNLTVKRSYGLV